MADLIEMSNISKAFGSSIALENVSLRLLAGSVHALMGENGAGKSTLMKVLAGVVLPEQGEILMDGTKLNIRTPKDALNNGISTVFQELSLLPNLTISENMFLGKEPTTSLGWIDRGTMNDETVSALTELGLNLNPNTLVSELTIAERQFVEIAHGITAKAKVIVLDEPTAALNAADVEILDRHIQSLKRQGKAIVYISHRMEEIFKICDTVTVLKDGRNVATHSISEVTPQSLIAMMVGRDIEDLFPARGDTTKETVLSFLNFQITSNSVPLSISVKRGEIVGLAGLEGQGQRDIFRSLIGQHHPHSGEIIIKGINCTLPVSPEQGVRQLQRMGVGFVPEDRKDEGLFLSLSIRSNISIILDAARWGYSLARHHQKVVSETMSNMDIKATGVTAAVGSLSGGNQQKVLLGRYLASGADVLIIEEPTRGVDIGAKVEIYRLLRNFVENGGAILMVSRETVEIIGLCDRLLVMHNKTVVSEMSAKEATEHKIMDAAIGG